jgi:xylose isomerase
VQAALEAAGVNELEQPTVAPGESLDDVRAQFAPGTYDLDALRSRSVAMEALDQLAMEHLLGVR